MRSACSVIELQSELDLPGIIGSIPSRPDFSEVRAGEVGRTGDGDNSVPTKSWSVEVRVIEDIEELRTELQGKPLAQTACL